MGPGLLKEDGGTEVATVGRDEDFTCGGGIEGEKEGSITAPVDGGVRWGAVGNGGGEEQDEKGLAFALVIDLYFGLCLGLSLGARFDLGFLSGTCTDDDSESDLGVAVVAWTCVAVPVS